MYHRNRETPLNHIGSEAFLLSLFRWTDLRQDFKEVLTDLLSVIAVGLADKPDGIRQQDVALCFLLFVFLPLFVFLIRDLLHLHFLLIKTAGTPRLSQLTPQTPTYPSSGKKAVGIIKLYQSRCFYILVYSLITSAFAVLNVFDDKPYVIASAVSEHYALTMMSLVGYLTHYLAWRKEKDLAKSY